MAVALGVIAFALIAVAEDIGTPGVMILERMNKGEPLRIAGAVPRSPAAKAGVKRDCFLIAVNGTNVVSMQFTQALSMVHGTVGTFVTLDLADSTMRHTNRFTLKRGKLVHEMGKLEVIDP